MIQPEPRAFQKISADKDFFKVDGWQADNTYRKLYLKLPAKA